MNTGQSFLSAHDLKQYLLRQQFLKNARTLALEALEHSQLAPKSRALEKSYWHISEQALRPDSPLNPGEFHFTVPRAHFGFVAAELQALGYTVSVRQLEASDYTLFDVRLP